MGVAPLKVHSKWMPRKGPVANHLRKAMDMTPKEYRKTIVALTNVVETNMCNKNWKNISYKGIPSKAFSKYQRAFWKNDPERFESFLNDCCLDHLSNDLESIPTQFTIKNNYPNPFNPETTISYSIPKTAWMSLSILDIKGELLTTLVDGVVNPGNYEVVWNGNNFSNIKIPTGIYFAILKTNEKLVSHKLLLMK